MTRPTRFSTTTKCRERFFRAAPSFRVPIRLFNRFSASGGNLLSAHLPPIAPLTHKISVPSVETWKSGLEARDCQYSSACRTERGPRQARRPGPFDTLLEAQVLVAG